LENQGIRVTGDMSIGENIKNLREEKGISQKVLAEAIGSGENTVSGWEKNKNSPPGDKIVAMAKFFGCSTDQILLDESDRNVSEDMKALFRRYNELDELLKPMARNIMNGMLGSLEMSYQWEMFETIMNRKIAFPMPQKGTDADPIRKEDFTPPPPRERSKPRKD
jgi:transcriptional regulator with XRE-family HTH domain